MSWWSDFASRIEPDAPVGKQTWYRVGGRARHLYRPRDAAELAAFLGCAADASASVKVLGSGANVLIRDDGFDGEVIRLDDECFRSVRRTGTTLEVGAGVDLLPLAQRCCEWGLAGLEGLAGIPATVGGAVRMNAGGRFGEIGPVVRQIETLTLDGSQETLTHEQIGFGYRHSDLGDRIVLSARLELREDDPDRLKNLFDDCLDHKRRSQPVGENSAGCVFKNPNGESAGALIDRAGLKNACCGHARVSQRHANFIVAQERATASEILRLIDLIRERVLREFGIELETEIDIW